jgi:hypothetical protein
MKTNEYGASPTDPTGCSAHLQTYDIRTVLHNLLYDVIASGPPLQRLIRAANEVIVHLSQRCGRKATWHQQCYSVRCDAV